MPDLVNISLPWISLSVGVVGIGLTIFFAIRLRRSPSLQLWFIGRRRLIDIEGPFEGYILARLRLDTGDELDIDELWQTTFQLVNTGNIDIAETDAVTIVKAAGSVSVYVEWVCFSVVPWS